MSAILMTCEHCGEGYMAGVVGRTPWPPHECPTPVEMGTFPRHAEFCAALRPDPADEDSALPCNCGLDEMRREIATLRSALVQAAVPLEVLHGQDSFWHPIARQLYRRVVSRELRAEIALAVGRIRGAIADERPQAPVAGGSPPIDRKDVP